MINEITNKEVNMLLEGTYIITMQTKTDKTLYLSMMHSEQPEWVFTKGDACVWDNFNECKTFAEKWFKNCKKWVIREYTNMSIIE